MATPYCTKHNQFATLTFCAEHCQEPMSTRRPSCDCRRLRKWADLSEQDRTAMRGNWRRKALHEQFDRQLTHNWTVAHEVRLAARQALKTGTPKVSVPIDLLQELLRALEVSQGMLAANGYSTGIVEGVNRPISVPIGK